MKPQEVKEMEEKNKRAKMPEVSVVIIFVFLTRAETIAVRPESSPRLLTRARNRGIVTPKHVLP